MKSTRASGTTARMIVPFLALLLGATALPATAAEGAAVSVATATDVITADQATALESLGLPKTLEAPDGTFDEDKGLMTLTNITPGTLKGVAEKLIEDSYYRPVYKLTVSGTSLNAADFEYMNQIEDCYDVNLSGLTAQTEVPDYAFYTSKGNSNIQTLTLPASVRKIGKEAFSYNRRLKNINLENITFIGDSAFVGCNALNFSKIGSDMVEIGAGAFEGCTGLGEMDLSNITYFGKDAFRGCTNLKATGGRLNRAVLVLQDGVFDECRSMDRLDLSNLIWIGNRALAGTRIGEVNLSKVVYLGAYAFSQCSNLTLTGGVLNAKITEIPKGAFEGCGKLTAINLSNITAVGEGAFSRCIRLADIKATSKLETVGKNAFFYCELLKNVDISKATSIGDTAFYKCSSIGSIDLSNVSSFGRGAFADCTRLTLVEGKPLGAKGAVIASEAFSGCTELGTVEMVNVATIDSGAFKNCRNMRIIDPEFSLFTIKGDAVFENCAKLGKVVLQQNVRKLGESVFAGCKNLEIYLESRTRASIRNNTFARTSNVTAYVPADMLPDYVNDVAWQHAIERQNVTLLGYTEDGGIITPDPPKPDDKDKNNDKTSGGSGAALGSADKPVDKPVDKPEEKPEPTPPATLPGTSPQEKKELLSFTIGADNYVYDGKTTAANANLGSAYLDTEGNAMLPLRAIAELMGYDVDWSAEAKQITIALPDGKRVVLNVGASEIYQNGRIIGQLTDASGKTITPTIKDGRAYLPVRAFFVEVLGMDAADVIYDIETQSIKIVTTQPQGGTV